MTHSTYGAERIALLGVPAPTRAHRAVSPHLDQRDTAARNSSPRMPVRDGSPRYCGTGPAGSSPAGDGHELPPSPVRRELHEPTASAAREPKPFSALRRRAAPEYRAYLAASGHQVRLPQVRGPGYVALCRPLPGAVVTYFVTDSRPLPPFKTHYCRPLTKLGAA